MPAAKDESINRMFNKAIVGLLGNLLNFLYNLTISS